MIDRDPLNAGFFRPNPARLERVFLCLEKLLAITLDGISLPEHLFWEDEFDFSPVAQAQERAITGALHVHEAAKIKGRPITLSGGSEYGWGVTRVVIEQLQAKFAAVNSPMSLNYNGATFTVLWNRDGGSEQAMSVEPLWGRRQFEADEAYIINALRFIEVNA